jgi:hypothetical protein
MRVRSALLVAGMAVAGLVTAAPATAAPIDKGHFHDVYTDTFNCDGTPLQIDGDVYVNFLFNQRGSSPFPYYRESLRGTITVTNLNTGGTFTTVLAVSTSDHKIVDNGDGTITITTLGRGGARYYDQYGRLVLKDPGRTVSAVDINYNGTPGNPEDDQEVPGSFRIVRPSTGNSDFSERDFCADVVQFTS